MSPMQVYHPVQPFAQTPKYCLVVEIFAGSCRLSKACKNLGFQVAAIDKDKNRSENFTTYQCDVGNSDELKLLKEYLDSEQLALLHVHFAPSCGTASRAREKPIPNVPEHQQPRPLRSDAHPAGLPTLNAVDQSRVDLANKSYQATANLIDFLTPRRISVSIENPLNSLFWKFQPIRDLITRTPGHRTIFDACMHGGNRDKATLWWSFNPRSPADNLFQSLNLRCDRSHSHASWAPQTPQGKLNFPPAQEAAYPPLLCSRIAFILKDEAISRGFLFPHSLEEQMQHDDSAGKRQLFATQPQVETNGCRIFALFHPGLVALRHTKP